MPVGVVHGIRSMLDLYHTLADSMRLKPVQLYFGDRTILELYRGYSLSLEPVTTSVQPNETPQYTDAVAGCDRLLRTDLADELELHNRNDNASRSKYALEIIPRVTAPPRKFLRSRVLRPHSRSTHQSPSGASRGRWSGRRNARSRSLRDRPAGET